MNKKHLFLGIILFSLGLVGVLSILTMQVPIPAEAEALLKEQFTDGQIKLLLLINPAILLLLAVVIGTIFYRKTDLRLPIIEKLVGLNKEKAEVKSLITYGVAGGLLSGVLLSLVSFVFTPMLPAEFNELGENITMSLPARFLYGGITEEILMRFGLMSFITGIVFLITKKKTNVVYWSGIIIAALLFAVGHFPVAYQAVANPSAGLLIYILLGNTIGGLIFGWLYWKKGLESAFVAHIFTHVVLVISESFLLN